MGRLVLSPDRFVAGGDALARDEDGRVVFVRGAVPGETVVAEVMTAKKDWARADVVDVVDAVARPRSMPPCASRRAGCGGCGWQHLSIDAQRAARLAIVTDALRRIGRVDAPVVEPGGGVEPVGYRTTVRVAAGPDGRAGFRAERSHDVVPAPACLVAHPPLAALLSRLRLDEGVEATLRMSVATGELNARWDRRAGDVHGLPDGTPTGSAAAVHEDVAGRRLRVSMGSFFQSGPQAAELLVASITGLTPELADARVVVDAYCGRRDAGRQRHRPGGACHRHRDVAGGRRRRPPQPGRARGRGRARRGRGLARCRPTRWSTSSSPIRRAAASVDPGRPR